MTLDAWKVMELDPKMQEHLYLEQDIIQNSPEDTLFKSNGMHNSPFGVALHHWIWKNLKNKIDMNLQETYSYSRKYHRGAYLKAHADRPSCEVSATICLDYLTDNNKPWSIWVDNSRNWVDIVNGDNSEEQQEAIYNETQGVPIRKRNSVRIDLEVGDLLLYQGPNVIHWRDTLLGEYSYHMFLHYVTDASQMQQLGNSFVEDSRFSQYQRHILQYDGRKNPYGQIEEGNLSNPEQQEQWRRRYDLLPNKADFINNYDHLKIEKIKE